MKTKHSKIIVSAIVVVTLLLLAVFCVIPNFRGSEDDIQSGSKLTLNTEQEKEEVMQMTEYLSGIDRTVTSNVQQLQRSVVDSENTQDTLQQVTDTLPVISNQISQVESILTDSIMDGMDSSAIQLRGSLLQTKNELMDKINVVQKESKSLLSEIKKGNDKDIESIYKRIENLQLSLEEVKSSTQNYHDDLTTIIDLMKNQDVQSSSNTSIVNTDDKSGNMNLDDLESQIVEGHENISTQNAEETKDIANKVSEGNKGIQSQLSEESTQLNKEHQEIVKSLEKVQQDLSKSVEDKLSTLNVGLDEDVKNIMSDMDDLHNQVDIAQTELADILSVMEDSSSDRHEEVANMFADTKAYIMTIENKFSDAHSELQQLIADMREELKSNHTEMLSVLQGAQNELDKVINKVDTDVITSADMLADLINKLEQSDVDQYAELVNTLTNAQNDLNEYLSNQFDNADSHLETIYGSLSDANSKLKGDISKLQNTIDSNNSEMIGILEIVENTMQQTSQDQFSNLMSAMNSFEQSMNSTLTAMQEDVSSTLSATNDKIENNFQNMNDKLETNIQQTNQQLNQSIQSLSESMTNSFSETKSELQNVSNSIQNVNQTTQQSLSELSQSITEQNNELTKNINNDISNKITNLQTTINNYNTESSDSMDELKSYLDEQLKQVFQSVSDGKALLASALLTKGVALEEDATFLEIYEGIMSSPRIDDPALAATADNISEGKQAWVNGDLITGNGADVNTAYNKGYLDGLNKAMNGASISYTYHQHTGSSTTGGGCYTKPISHSHSIACVPWMNVQYGSNVICSRCGANNGRAEHSAPGTSAGYYCGACYRAGRWICGQGTGVTGYDLGCNKTTSTVESAVIKFN